MITETYRNIYNIKQNDVLKNLEFEQFQQAPIPKECQNCALVAKCRGGVYDRRILWNNTLEKRDPYCPYENGDNLNKQKMKIMKKERISVHDGYLPTMFFRN